MAINDSSAPITYQSYVLAVMLISILLVLPWLSIKPFYSKGEPREAAVAQAMLNSGNWILPRRYGDEIPTKPPFAHWMMALASLPGGEVTEFSARLPSAILSTVAVLCFCIFLSRRVTPSFAATASLLLIGSIEWHRASLTCRVDMPLAALFLLAFISLFRWEERNLKNYPWLLVMFTVLATLTKGPVAPALVCAVATLYLLLLGYRSLTIAFVIARIIVPSLLFPLIWYTLAYSQAGNNFFWTVWNENVGRLTSNMLEGEPPHAASAWYLYSTVFLGLTPWSIVLFCAPKLLFTKLWCFISANTQRPLAWLRSLTKLDLFTFLIISVFTVFYSIPSSKRSVYLLPIYPFLCISLAKLYFLVFKTNVAAVKKLVLGVSGIIICAYFLAISVWTNIIDLGHFLSKPRQIAQYEYVIATLKHLSEGSSSFSLLALFFPVALITLVLTVPAFKRTQSSAALCLVWFSLLITLNAKVLPQAAMGVSAKGFAEQISAAIPAEAILYSFGERLYGLNFYLKNRIVQLRPADFLSKEAYVLVRKNDLGKLEQVLTYNYTIEKVLISPHSIEKPSEIVTLVKINSPG